MPDKAYKKVVKDILPVSVKAGYRHILKARYGKEVLHSDAFDFWFPGLYGSSKSCQIEPIDQPELKTFISQKMNQLLLQP